MAPVPESTRKLLDTVRRQEYGRILAGLVRFAGSLNRAEEAVQEGFASALAEWGAVGGSLPPNPAVWIAAAARRNLVEAARRDRRLRLAAGQVSGDEEELPDDRLELLFICCHPALDRHAQVALTLHTLGGLTAAELARAFLVTEATMTQRLMRAKRRVQMLRLPFEAPPQENLPQRLEAVLAVLQLIFNEGYYATSGETLLRRDLSTEAIRLTRLLCTLMPQEGETWALMALMLMQDARREARVSASGEFVALEEQDRSRWDRNRIEEGLSALHRGLALPGSGPRRLQAAIAALHICAESVGATDWSQIAALYARLAELQPTPVVRLNQAVAIAMAEGCESGLDRLDQLAADGTLENYHLFHAARADLLRRLGRNAEAAAAYRRALDLAGNAVELKYLRRRLAEVTATEPAPERGAGHSERHGAGGESGPPAR